MNFIKITVAMAYISTFILKGSCQFGFNNQFELNTDKEYPTQGTNVVLKCRRTQNYKQRDNFVSNSERNRITWKRNGQPLMATVTTDSKQCSVFKDQSYITRSQFGTQQPSFPSVSCEDDGTTVKLTIANWTPESPVGERWQCIQFPFAESNPLVLKPFVPVTQVSIEQEIDKGQYYKPSAGTIVTCVTSPSRPSAFIDWFLRSENGDTLLSSHLDLKERVDNVQNGLTMTTSSILFTQDSDHGMKVLCKCKNQADQVPVPSTTITLVVKYPPTVTVSASPSVNVVLGKNVSLSCAAFGRPVPKVSWTREIRIKNVDTGEDEKHMTVVSQSPTLTLSSVSLADGGEYFCTAENGLKPVAKGSVFLHIREPPELTVSVKPNSDVFEGSQVELTCKGFGRPSPEVRWMKKNTNKDKNKPERKFEIISVDPVLTIKSISLADAGLYVCVGDNGVPPVARQIVTLTVKEKEIVTSKSDEIAGNNGITTDSDDNDSGAIAGGVIASVVIVLLVVVVVLLVVRYRRTKQEILAHRASLQRPSSPIEPPDVYAVHSSLPRGQGQGIPHPPYVELLPPPGSDRKLPHVANPGYGLGDTIINGHPQVRSQNSHRPLPNTPLDADSGYEELDDVIGRHTYYQNKASTSEAEDYHGYLVPVTQRSLSMPPDELPTWSRAETQKIRGNTSRRYSTNTAAPSNTGNPLQNGVIENTNPETFSGNFSNQNTGQLHNDSSSVNDSSFNYELAAPIDPDTHYVYSEPYAKAERIAKKSQKQRNDKPKSHNEGN